MRKFFFEPFACDMGCRDMEGEAMQSIYAEVQQYLLGKFGNLVAVCLPEHLKVSSCCVASECVSACSACKTIVTGSILLCSIPPVTQFWQHTPSDKHCVSGLDTLCSSHNAVLQGESGSAAWARSLCEDNPTDQKSSHQALACVPICGRLMVAVDILKNSTSLSAAAQLACAEHLLPLVVGCFCKHVPIEGDGGPELGTAIVHAMVVFMAACNSDRYDHCTVGIILFWIIVNVAVSLES